jgi:folylpolyglutamate synthase/dihydropteroate synthase
MAVELAAVAAALLRELAAQGIDVPATSTAEGLAHPVWPGRLEVRDGRPMEVWDGAHNPAGMQRLVGELMRLRGRF